MINALEETRVFLLDIIDIIYIYIDIYIYIYIPPPLPSLTFQVNLENILYGHDEKRPLLQPLPLLPLSPPPPPSPTPTDDSPPQPPPSLTLQVNAS